MQVFLNRRKDLVEKKMWKAQWIHGNVEGKGPHYLYFRKVVEISEQIIGACLFITADKNYKLLIDGRFVGEGPIRSSSHYWSYDTYNVTEDIQSGKHAICVIVAQWDPSYGNPLALFAQLELTYADKTVEIIGTDCNWKVYKAKGWRNDVPLNLWAGGQRGYVEIRDMRLDDFEWETSEFNDANWEWACAFTRGFWNEEVRCYGHRWSYLVNRDIPFFKTYVRYPTKITSYGELKSTDMDYYRSYIGDHLWIGMDNILPLSKSEINNCETFLNRESEIELKTCYEGECEGGILWQPAIVFDMGDLLNGYIRIDIEGSAGSVIDLSFSQTLQDGKVYPYTTGIHRVSRFILKQGRQQIEGFNYENLRFLQLTLRSSEDIVKLYKVSLRVVEYPVKHVGCFKCSDELLTRVWTATERTTKLCMLDVFMDNTWREKQGWGGDVSTIILSVLACYGEMDIIKRYLRMFIYDQLPSGALPVIVPGHGSGLIDHSMAYPLRLWEYFLWTADLSLLHELYPGLRRYMEYLEKYETSDFILDEMPESLWFDWALIDRRKPSVILNFYYYSDVMAMIRIAKVLELTEDIAVFEYKAEQLRNSINAFWDKDREIFPDCLINGVPSINISEDTNGIALYTGIASRTQSESIARNVFSSSFDIYAKSNIKKSGPPFSIYVLMGLCKNGFHNTALNYIRERHGSAFQQGLDTMPEQWIYTSIGGTSAAQATLAAAYVLTTEILGIKPLEPGFSKIFIDPHPCDLTWASGTLPTVKGLLSLSWFWQDKDFIIEADFPSELSAEICLPYIGRGVEVSPESGDVLYDRPTEQIVTLNSGGKYRIRIIDITNGG